VSEFTARWQAGGGILTVTCAHGRVWVYAVVEVGDRPLPHFLYGLPWMLPPGARWEQDGAEGEWAAPVAPVSAEAAEELFSPQTGPVQPGVSGSLPSGD